VNGLSVNELSLMFCEFVPYVIVILTGDWTYGEHWEH